MLQVILLFMQWRLEKMAAPDSTAMSVIFQEWNGSCLDTKWVSFGA